jgi:hydrogenase maturation protease
VSLPLVLCLGNEVLSDDAFGKFVCEELLREPNISRKCEIVFATLAGFSLLDLLNDYEDVLIVDAMVMENPDVGRLHLFSLDSLQPTLNLCNSHQMSLPTAVHLGTSLGYNMPTKIDVLAVEALDVETLSEEMTPKVAAAVGAAKERALLWVSEQAKCHAASRRDLQLT